MSEVVVITGGAGYIGSHISWALSQQGYSVIILDNFLYSQPVSQSWATVVRGDYGDKELLSQVFQNHNPIAVIHCAARIEVGLSCQDPLLFYQENVSKMIALLRAMSTHNIKKFIFSSSAAVYGNASSTSGYISEDYTPNPINPYGTTKLMGETILRDCARAFDISYVAFRYFNVAGAFPEHDFFVEFKKASHLIPILFDAAFMQKRFTIFGVDHSTKDGTCVRDFIHVRDIAHAHLCALQHLQKGRPSDCFNLGSGRGISVRQMIAQIEEVSNKKIPVAVGKARHGDPDQLIADWSKAQAILGWIPRYSDLDFIIKSAYQLQQKQVSTNCYSMQQINL